MRPKVKFPVTRTAAELADLLGLSKEDSVKMELGSDLNAKIIDVVKRRKLTHLEVAKLSGTSRTRITALLNCNTKHISTSLLIRVLAALGVRVRVSYSPIRFAA